MIKKFTPFLFVFAALTSYASNIQVTNVSLTSPDVSAGSNNAANFTMLQFDLTWENSWRISSGPSNWDAAWIFMKYRVGTGPWQHAFLNNTGHLTGTGTSATITSGLQNTGNAFNVSTNPAMGVFVHRSADGSGTFTQSGIQVRWNYGANGVTDLSVVDIKVFAIEMVYVPGGVDFNVGGSGGTSAFTSTTINTSSATTAPSGTGSLGGSAGGYPTGQTGPSSDDWPNGYAAFYCMKYEMSQGQYRDFLNVLTRDQQASRVATTITTGTTSVTNRFVMSNNSNRTSRNVIRCDATISASDPIVFYCDLNSNGNGNESADGEFLACNYLSWPDGAAFADWAGLRPMSELEFEKSCRGPLNAVTGEYAWGSTTIAGSNSVTNGGTVNEKSSNASANACYHSNNPGGPVRVGMYAGPSTTRALAGATYYGILDMSGNNWDRTVSLAVAAGKSFTKSVHGDGELTSDGFSTIATWPGLVLGKITSGSGGGARGGAWLTSVGDGHMNVSSRTFANYNDNGGRIQDFGFRAVRTAN
jgi:formylglycine-generating enzyme required for sulfatase activity